MIDEPLYEAFYGLREQPFSLTTDPRFLYLSAAHRQAFDDLLTGLRRREGLLVLTGETGTGKTTLCRAVIDALGHRTFAALILNPYMTDAEVVRTIVRDFGLVTREDIRRGAFDHADLPQLLDTLEAFLRSLVPLNSYAVVIIDEAQSLSAPVLDQIRMLGSMEVEGRRLLQIVLVGQPGLSDTLAGPALRALSDRISRRDVLDPLPVDDVGPYITHRLAIAGGREAVTFDAAAIQRIAADGAGVVLYLAQEGRGIERQTRDVVAGHEHAALGSALGRGDEFEQGGLACPRGTEHGDELAAFDLEVDAAQGVGPDAAIGFADCAQFDHVTDGSKPHVASSN